MAGLRFEIHLDGFIPENESGVLVGGIKIPKSFAEKIPTIRQKVRDIKEFVGSTNRKLGGENLILQATWHICFHNEQVNKPCPAGEEI